MRDWNWRSMDRISVMDIKSAIGIYRKGVFRLGASYSLATEDRHQG
jgi:hypothetical protein